MAVKLSELKNNTVRVKIPFIREGIKDIITIFNPTQEQRSKLMQYLSVKIQKIEGEEKELKIKAEDMIKIFFKELTDLDIKDENIKEILENRSEEVIEVHKHINDILHELLMEMFAIKKRDLQRLEEFKAQSESIKDLKAFLDGLGLTKEKLGEVGVKINPNESEKEGEVIKVENKDKN